MIVKVNKKQWEALGEEEQNKIIEVISGFFKGAEILPDEKTPEGERFGLPNFCKIACKIAQEAAETACASLGDPTAIRICQAAAKAAGDECRKLC